MGSSADKRAEYGVGDVEVVAELGLLGCNAGEVTDSTCYVGDTITTVPDNTSGDEGARMVIATTTAAVETTVADLLKSTAGDGGEVSAHDRYAAPDDRGVKRSGEGTKSACKKQPGNVKVTNLSGTELTADQLSLLSRGLGFVPVKRQRMTHLLAELKEWERLVRLKEFWADTSLSAGTGVARDSSDHDTDSSVDQDSKYKKSRWTPEKGRDPWLDVYIEEVIRSVLGGVKKDRDSNLTKGEEQAFLDLMNDSDIVIRPADKGSGIVVMDAETYFGSLQEEVNDPSTYRSTARDQTQAVYKKVKTLADKLLKKGYIGKHLHKYLIPTRPRAGHLQGNPKLHKEGHPLRAIVSGRGHATEGIAELAEKELCAHVESQASFVRDTTDFINKIKGVKLPTSSGTRPL